MVFRIMPILLLRVIHPIVCGVQRLDFFYVQHEAPTLRGQAFQTDAEISEASPK